MIPLYNIPVRSLIPLYVALTPAVQDFWRRPPYQTFHLETHSLHVLAGVVCLGEVEAIMHEIVADSKFGS